jgi:hypothetical protein
MKKIEFFARQVEANKSFYPCDIPRPQNDTHPKEVTLKIFIESFK